MTKYIFWIFGIMFGIGIGSYMHRHSFDHEKKVYQMYNCGQLTGLEMQICEVDKAEIAEMVGKKVFGVE